jgi:hypothetical protein
MHELNQLERRKQGPTNISDTERDKMIIAIARK